MNGEATPLTPDETRFIEAWRAAQTAAEAAHVGATFGVYLSGSHRVVAWADRWQRIEGQDNRVTANIHSGAGSWIAKAAAGLEALAAALDPSPPAEEREP